MTGDTRRPDLVESVLAELRDAGARDPAHPTASAVTVDPHAAVVAHAAGVRVAQAWADSDPLNPQRPTLAQLVAAEVAAAADESPLRQRITDTITQRERLVAERVAIARRRIDEGNYGAAASELRWAASLHDEAGALRTMLT